MTQIRRKKSRQGHMWNLVLVCILVAGISFQRFLLEDTSSLLQLSLLSLETPPKRPIGYQSKLLLGIHCDDSDWRQSIRQTSLDYYKTIGRRLGHSPEIVCPWGRGGGNPADTSTYPSDCRIVYTFFQTTNCSSTTAEPTDGDTLCLRASSMSPAPMAWLQFAQQQLLEPNKESTAKGGWKIGYADSRTMLQFPLLMDTLDEQDVLYEAHAAVEQNNIPQFASSDFFDMAQCGNETFRAQVNHAMLCRRRPSARLYWMTPDLVSVLNNWSGDLQDGGDVDLYVRKTVQSYLQQHQLPPPSIIPSPFRVKLWKWQHVWDQLTGTVAQDVPASSSYLWNHLPCLYVTAKFGKHPETFREAVLERRRQLIWNYGWTPRNLVSYFDFPSFILQDPRWKEHLAFRTQDDHPSARGAGFWFWKAPLVQYHLRQLEMEGGYLPWLVYADTDLVDHMGWLPSLLEALQLGDYDMALYQMPYLDQDYTSPTVMNELCGNSRNRNLSKLHQHAGGLLVLRNTASTRHLIDTWVDAASRYDWISGKQDPHFKLPPTYVDHRHDQSLLSALLHCRHAKVSDTFTGSTTLNDWTVQMIKLQGVN
eukprot:Nitzschia sp. Nitz4//scaffold28_size193895//171630//173492//NITZ4_001687-RA/size193895-augustus-gene-0.315-mRNA-1//-1//CDS//3329546048//4363//frame0